MTKTLVGKGIFVALHNDIKSALSDCVDDKDLQVVMFKDKIKVSLPFGTLLELEVAATVHMGKWAQNLLDSLQSSKTAEVHAANQTAKFEPIYTCALEALKLAASLEAELQQYKARHASLDK